MTDDLRNLKGLEFTFKDLDKKMVELGFYSMFEHGITSNVKFDRSIVYTGKGSDSCEIIIDFEITVDNDENEAENAFELLVTDVNNFYA